MPDFLHFPVTLHGLQQTGISENSRAILCGAVKKVDVPMMEPFISTESRSSTRIFS